MKHLIIAGVPRAGKSTLARQIARELGWQHVSMDAIIAGFEQCFPETGVDTGIAVNEGKPSMEILRIISGKMGPFLRAMTSPEEYDEKNGPMVIDMYQLLPEDYVKFLDPEICGVLYLLTGDVTPEERFTIQKTYDAPEDYTYFLSDGERMEGCYGLVEQSRLMRGQCERLGLPYYETAHDREAVFAKIIEGVKREAGREISPPEACKLSLVRPELEMKREALAFREEFFQNGEPIIYGSELLDKTERYEDWLDAVARNADPETVSPDWVLTDTFFAVDEAGEIAGIIDLRRQLNDFLTDLGNCGYSVRPSRRGKGCARQMLGLVLAHARSVGMEELHIAVERDNLPSVRVIRGCGGRYERSFSHEGEAADVYRFELGPES